MCSSLNNEMFDESSETKKVLLLLADDTSIAQGASEFLGVSRER